MDAVTLRGQVVVMIDLNPLNWLGDKAKEGLADGWTAAMISLWSAGMWLLESVFKILDRFLTPDVGDPGLVHLYGVTLWISFLIALIIAFGQIALAAIRRDGTSLGALVVGVVQYGAVVTCWVAVCGGLILACGGLTTGLLEVLLDVEDFSGYKAGAGWPDQVGGTVAATALGMCSLVLLIPAGFGYVLIMLVREAALLVLTATMPIAAAGALGEGAKSWMWKSIRWIVAAALTAPLLALVLGVGVQITRAAFPDGTDGTTVDAQDKVGAAIGAGIEIVDQSSQVGMAVVGSVIMVIACFCPMALFRLLAFVDPGTGSGASFRSSLSANGGLGGLMSGKGATDQGSGAATQSATDGRASSEGSADTETANRFQTKFATTFGAGGAVAAGTMKGLGSIAQHGASMGVDVMGQGGFGSQGYYDTTLPARRGSSNPVRTRVGIGHDNSGDDPGGNDSWDDWNDGGNDPAPDDRPDNKPGGPGGSSGTGVANHPTPPAGTSGSAGLAEEAVLLA